MAAKLCCAHTFIPNCDDKYFMRHDRSDNTEKLKHVSSLNRPFESSIADEVEKQIKAMKIITEWVQFFLCRNKVSTGCVAVTLHTKKNLRSDETWNKQRQTEKHRNRLSCFLVNEFKQFYNEARSVHLIFPANETNMKHRIWLWQWVFVKNEMNRCWFEICEKHVWQSPERD